MARLDRATSTNMMDSVVARSGRAMTNEASESQCHRRLVSGRRTIEAPMCDTIGGMALPLLDPEPAPGRRGRDGA